jgi:hypothetical protein
MKNDKFKPYLGQKQRSTRITWKDLVKLYINIDERREDIDWIHVIEGSVQHTSSYSMKSETHNIHPHLVSTINTSLIVFIVYIFLGITDMLIHLLYKFVMRKTILVLWIQPQALTNLPINVKLYFINSQLVDWNSIIQTGLNNQMSHFFHALLVDSLPQHSRWHAYRNLDINTLGTGHLNC